MKMQKNELSFLDCLDEKDHNGTFNLNIYRKPMHSNSAHPFSAKTSLAFNLFRRATKIITSINNNEKEMKNIRNVLKIKNFS